MRRSIDKMDDELVCDGLEEIWSLINGLASELTTKGIQLPHHMRTAMNGVKIMINLCRHHPKLEQVVSGPGTLDAVEGLCVGCCGRDIVARIECELRNIEDMLVVKAFGSIGEYNTLDWQSRLTRVWERVGPDLQRTQQ